MVSDALGSLLARPSCGARGVASFAPFEGTGRQAWGVAHTELRRLLVFLFKVLLGQSTQFGAVFLLNEGPFPIELLNILKPGDAVPDPSARRSEAILESFGQTT